MLVSNSAMEHLDAQQSYWAYNALDAAVTLEVWEELTRQLHQSSPICQRTYNFERALQNPAFDMQLSGVRINPIIQGQMLKMLKGEGKGQQGECDAFKRAQMVDAMSLFGEELAEAQDAFAAYEGKKNTQEFYTLRRTVCETEKRIASATGFTYGKGLPPSTHQLQKLLYGVMGIPSYRNKKGKVSLDKDCLTRIGKKYKRVTDFCALLQSMRDKQKQIEVLETGLSPDGRFRSMFNVGQTETGRFSSNEDPFGDGSNMQNLDRRLRIMFIADPGKDLVNFDLSQAESCSIAHLSQDVGYIQAHKDGNVHVEAGRAFWPDELPWNGDNDHDKKLMKMTPASWIPQPDLEPGEEPVFSFYDMSKRGQHGSNYLMTPYGLSHVLGCKPKMAEELQGRFFTRYPMIAEYHKWVAAELLRVGYLVTPGLDCLKRQFFERPWEKATVREAVAHVPQSLTAYLLNLGMLRVWKEFGPERLQLLQNGYDSILGQVDETDQETPGIIEKMLLVSVSIHGRIMTIPVESGRGKNWRDLG